MKTLEEALLTMVVTGDAEKDAIRIESYNSITDEVASTEAAQLVQGMIEDQLSIFPGFMENVQNIARNGASEKSRLIGLAILSALKCTFAAGVCVGIEMEKP